ncbi:unnamed protein product [Ascophyllum nodosum]
MSRKVPAGSLEAAAQSMAQEISGNRGDWKKRRHALVSMQHAIEEVTKSGRGGPSVFSADLWRYLKEPLKYTLNDLRSALVKEACILLEKLSTAAGNSMAPFMRDVLNVLLQLLTNGNSVISAQVNSCLRQVIEHTRFPRQLREMHKLVRNSRSKDVREMVASYVRLILGTWPAASMEREIASLESLVSMQLADASSAARTDARASFGLFQQHWPKRAGKILEGADPRTSKHLREEYGLDGHEDAASTAGRRTSTKAPARSSDRAPKPEPKRKPTGAGAGTAGARMVGPPKPFLKKGSSSSEGSARAVNRATPRSTVGGGGGASGGGNGNGNGKSPRSPAPATSKSRRTVSSTSPSKASSSTKTGSSITPPSPAARSSSTLGAAGGRRRPPHAPPGVSISPTSPPAPGSRSQTRRKDRFLMRTPPGSSVSRTRPKTAGHSPLLVGSGAKARPPLVPGDKVRLKGSSPRSAVVRYVGETHFATGIWVCVELSHSVGSTGKNNGSVDGAPHFRCPLTRGIFLRANMVDPEEVKDDEDSEPFSAEWWGAKGVRGQTGRAHGVEATEGDKEAMSVGADLLRCHKLFTNEAMEALRDEVGTLRVLKGAVESGEVMSSDRLRYFSEILESAAEAREAAASRLRAQIRQATRRHPGIFDTPIASDFLSQSLYSDHGSL